MSFPIDVSYADVACRIGWTLVHSLWQCAVVAIVLAVALQALRRRSANARYMVACAGLATMFVGFVVTLFVLPTLEENEASTVAAVGDGQFESVPASALPKPFASHHIPPDVAVVEGLDAGGIGQEDLGDQAKALARAAQAEPDVSNPSLSERATSALNPWIPWIAAGWLLGVLLLSVWNVGGWLTARRLRLIGVSPVEPDTAGRFAKLVDRMKVSRTVRLLRSAVVEVPITVGWLRPTILLPLGLITGLTPSELDAIIVHELAHIRRHDYLVNLLQIVIETLLFYHPAVWWLSRRIRIERENCCDDWAVAVTGDSLSYARTLTRFGELRHAGERRLSVGQAVSADGGSLLSRVRRLLPAPRDDHARPRTWLAGSMVLAMVAILVVTISYMSSGSGVVKDVRADVPAGDIADVTDETGSTDAPRFPEAEVYINNQGFGPTNGSTGRLKLTGSAECGHPGHVSRVTWKFLESTPEGDAYHFTRTYPADGKNPDTNETRVTYHGKPIVIFEDDVQRIGIRPLLMSETVLRPADSGKDQPVVPLGMQLASGYVGEEIQFGPVVERELHNGQFLDFATGRICTPPAELDLNDRAAALRWSKQSGADVRFLFDRGTRKIQVLDSWMSYVDAKDPNQYWDAVTSNGLRKSIMDGWWAGQRFEQPPEVSAMSNDPKCALEPRLVDERLPGPVHTFMNRGFTTGDDHALGMFQVLGFPDDSPGIRLRYRLLVTEEAHEDQTEQPANDAQRSPPSGRDVGPSSGRLEFRVAPYDPSAGKKPTLDAGALKSYRDWLKQGRTGDWWAKLPAIAGRMPDHMWLPTRLKDRDCRELITGQYNGKTYVLVSDVPEQVMLSQFGEDQSWGLARVYRDTYPTGKPSIGLEFDANGRKLIEALTKANLGSALAIIIDGQVIAAPVVRESFRDRAVVTGDFTDKEAEELVRALRASGEPDDTATWPARNQPPVPPGNRLASGDPGEEVQFGPVVERELKDGQFFDFTTGRICTPPKELNLDDRAALFRWGLQSGADARFLLDGGKRKMQFVNMWTAYVDHQNPNQYWNDLDPEDLRKSVNSGWWASERTMLQEPPEIAERTAEPSGLYRLLPPSPLDDRLPGLVHIFMTHNGLSQGALQVTAFPEDPPRVKIRYRLLVTKEADKDEATPLPKDEQPTEAGGAGEASSTAPTHDLLKKETWRNRWEGMSLSFRLSAPASEVRSMALDIDPEGNAVAEIWEPRKKTSARYESVLARDELDTLARQLGWQRPWELHDAKRLPESNGGTIAVSITVEGESLEIEQPWPPPEGQRLTPESAQLVSALMAMRDAVAHVVTVVRRDAAIRAAGGKVEEASDQDQGSTAKSDTERTALRKVLDLLDLPWQTKLTAEELDEAAASVRGQADEAVEAIFARYEERGCSNSFRHRAVQILQRLGTAGARAALLDIALGRTGDELPSSHSWAARAYLEVVPEKVDARQLLTSREPGVLNPALLALRGVAVDAALLNRIGEIIEREEEHPGDWRGLRVPAAQLLAADSRPVLLPERVELLVAMLSGVAQMPERDTVGYHSQMTHGEIAYSALLNALTEMPAEADPFLKNACEEQRGVVREILVIARANRGERTVRKDMHAILADDQAGLRRAWAARALGVIGTLEDLPLLKRIAEADPLEREWRGDVGLPGSQQAKFYPVRDAAKDAVQTIEERRKGRSGMPERVEPVEGVQARLRRVHPQNQAATVVRLLAEVRNRGQRDLMVARAQELCELEIDGRRYRWGGDVDVKSSWFPPDRRYEGIWIELSDQWKCDGESLEFKPGRHSVRVWFVAEPTEKDGGKPVRFATNPVEIVPDDHLAVDALKELGWSPMEMGNLIWDSTGRVSSNQRK